MKISSGFSSENGLTKYKSNLKRSKLLVLFVFLFFDLHIYSQSKYLIKDEEGFDFVLHVAIDGNRITGFTRENALLDYASRFEYTALKIVSSLKHPEIIRFNATLNNQGFEGTYDYLFSSYKIIGEIKQDSIRYSLYDNKDKLRRRFEGARIDNHKKKNYEKLTEDIIKTTEENIFDPKIIQTQKWKRFKEKMMHVTSKISDDLEFQIGFFALTRNFGFSHYYLFKNVGSTKREPERPSLKEINENTVLLKISSFTENGENIKPLLDTIQQKAYGNLIIDLRDNPGGNFESTLLVADFLTEKEFIGGIFPNRMWYKEYDRLPNKNDIDKFSLIDCDTTQMQSKYGFYVRTKGSDNSFKGKTYLLVNKRTGSAAEALTIGAKEYHLAKIIGEKTAGGLLSAKDFKIDEDIVLLVPTNDFISYHGYRVDRKGVKPDIKTKKGQELERLIEMIKKNN